jgi:hypothetical protein
MRLKWLVFALLALSAALSAQTKYYGGIDLGSKGTKASLFYFVRDVDARDARVLFGKSINTKIVSSMTGSQFSPEGIEDATNAVTILLEEMKKEAAKQKLKDVTYFVVGSSGVAKGSNKDKLAESVMKATGIDMDFIDAKHEGYFSLVSSVPRASRARSILIDVGSGNTKLGCLVGDADFTNFRGAEIPFGSVSGRNATIDAWVKKKRAQAIAQFAEKNGHQPSETETAAIVQDITPESITPSEFPVAVQDLMKERVGPSYSKESRDAPCLQNRQRIYWTGGAAWATATFIHPEGALKGYVILSHRDLDAFLARLTDGSWNQRKPTYSFPKDMSVEHQQAIRARAEKDTADVMNVFVREDLLSGVSIMKTALDVGNPSSLILFVRNGSFLYGYALDKFKEDAEPDSTSSH